MPASEGRDQNARVPSDAADHSLESIAASVHHREKEFPAATGAGPMPPTTTSILAGSHAHVRTTNLQAFAPIAVIGLVRRVRSVGRACEHEPPPDSPPAWPSQPVEVLEVGGVWRPSCDE